MSKVRCAIYTRKSSEEGLEQDFNSLDAQREACAAYVLSQASEGWSLLDEPYDDGGLSGGTLERPALQRLMADIEAGKIDIVVVYKVDRLTRSLLDFARLVETFDAAGISFVSVTQSFNTTNSMGRLTLNMLLSFAQFEREVTAERIRDKIAASKAKGMWMGGIPPLGYRGEDRTLVVVPEHAELIRKIFERYLAIGNVRLLAEALQIDGIRVPLRTTGTGRMLGGCTFSRGQIYKLLSNPTYLGKICHRGETHEGQHEAIIDRSLWDKVQARLAENTKGVRRAPRTETQSLLAGLLFDERGEPLVAEHCSKPAPGNVDEGKVRYRYYVSRCLRQAGNNEAGLRIPAKPLEELVMIRLARLIGDPINLITRAELDVQPWDIERVTHIARQVAIELRDGHRERLRRLLTRVEIGSQSIVVRIDPVRIADALAVPRKLDAAREISITIDAQLRRTGKVVRFVDGNDAPLEECSPQRDLVELLVQARAWWQEMQEVGLSPSQMAERYQTDGASISRAIRLNFLAPRIIECILAGTQPDTFNKRYLMRIADLPIDWDKQEQLLLAK